ncbi:3-deoxy-D-manno-octulosonic acid transferase [Pedobacter jejuensis]|uniref:3-deoxy-D-manno-octulosonic acid transferase n=1 Tax=Pedobacter jejuensis TaxID=1268550 RepID=A0A3N0BYN0_9SPHI|nr:glycosyltransferase N-terminal domain-containing protein [Pedobacter jejuensis]RNL54923.1 3-deoxy-D-manno-octulosonic acid transferase [Pedobacter jejuensis]
MLLLYTIGIKIYNLIIWFFSFFNTKAALFISGRKQIFKQIAEKINPNDRNIWFHFASLGEFEQGRPVLEKIKELHPEKKIIITFFSPSGYEIRKNYALADGIFYLPLDGRTNAKRFIELINPEMAIFTKYEFWYYYFKALKTNNIPLYIISGIFRKEQVFFRFYGGFYRKILKNVTHFFVQNDESSSLLRSIGLNNVTLSGDTRFDRVYENAIQPKNLPLIESFCEDAKVMVCGSTWPDDEKLLSVLPDKYPNWKFIIAPHEIDERHLQSIENQFSVSSLRYSVLSHTSVNPHDGDSDKKVQILIIDNIGILSALYQYGQIAYIGGGFGAGIHNTLEAAAFGLPVIFGPKFNKFQEAKGLIKINAAKSVSSVNELIEAFEDFKSNDKASAAAKKYVFDKKGATESILKKINF